MTNNVKKALKFVKSLVGKKYKWWTPKTDQFEDSGPLWSVNGKVPSKIDGLSCTGLINLVRRSLNLPIPGTEIKNFKYPGGTWIWFNSLKKKGVLEKFNPKKVYPVGTLLLRTYKNEEDQGHVAILYKENKDNVFLSKIIHSYSNTPYDPKGGYSTPGVTIENLGFSHFAFDDDHKGYFTHICLPKNWLS